MRKRVLIRFLWIFIPLVSFSGNIGCGSRLDHFTFAVMSDNHVYTGGFGGVDSPAITTDVVNDIIAQKANIVFSAGDEVAGAYNSYTDLATQLTYYQTIVSTPLHNAGIAFYPTLGKQLPYLSTCTR